MEPFSLKSTTYKRRSTVTQMPGHVLALGEQIPGLARYTPRKLTHSSRRAIQTHWLTVRGAVGRRQ